MPRVGKSMDRKRNARLTDQAADYLARTGEPGELAGCRRKACDSRECAAKRCLNCSACAIHHDNGECWNHWACGMALWWPAASPALNGGDDNG